jgi:hypothetical protein
MMLFRDSFRGCSGILMFPFRADERTFTAMLGRWRAQMLGVAAVLEKNRTDMAG